MQRKQRGPFSPDPTSVARERGTNLNSNVEQAKQRKFKGILNQMNSQNLDRLFGQAEDIKIDNVTTLTGLVSQIFDKALTVPSSCEMYAHFCQHLASRLPDHLTLTFRTLLLNKCQAEFERGEREEQEADSADSEHSEAVRKEMRVKVWKRMLDNIRLIGELYKKSILPESIMHECIKKLLGQYQKPDEENIKALCKLMSTITVGEMIDHPKTKECMGQLSNDMKLSSRVQFLLKAAMDFRKNKLQQRRMIEGPETIDEVLCDAAQESHGQVKPTIMGQPLESSPGELMSSSPTGRRMDGGYRTYNKPLFSPFNTPFDEYKEIGDCKADKILEAQPRLREIDDLQSLCKMSRKEIDRMMLGMVHTALDYHPRQKKY